MVAAYRDLTSVWRLPPGIWRPWPVDDPRLGLTKPAEGLAAPAEKLVALAERWCVGPPLLVALVLL